MPKKPRQLHSDLPIHVTARSNNRERFLISQDQMWELLSDYLHFISHAFGIRIISFVMMPNHFHLILVDPTLQLPQAMNYFLRQTSLEVGRLSGCINHTWGGPYHSSVITTGRYFLNAYKYTYRNPVQARLSNRVLDYRYSSLRGLCGLNRLLIPIQEDSTLFNNPDSVLRWLDEGFSEEEDSAIRTALKKSEMKFPREKNGRLSRLESVVLPPSAFDTLLLEK